MWVQAEYLPVSLFSLKLSLATSSGARSLVVPTPFAIKSALIDAAFQTEPSAEVQSLARSLVGATVAIRPCRRATITNLFARVLKPRREDGGAATRETATEEAATVEPGSEAGPYGKTIAYREYVHLDGSLGIAIELADEARAGLVGSLLARINYFGRRGGFFQLLAAPLFVRDLPAGYIEVGRPQPVFAADGLIQMLDDWGQEMTFERLDIYSPERIRLGRERVLHSTVLPYRRRRSSRSFTEYEIPDRLL